MKITDTFSQVARPKAYEKQKHQYLHLNLDPTSVASQVAAPKTKHQKLKIEFDDKDGECTPILVPYLILGKVRPGCLLT